MQPRTRHLILVGGVVALLNIALVVHAGLLTGEWVSLLACTPGILAIVAIVGSMLCGMFFFEAEEEDEPKEAASPDGGGRITDVVHRIAIQLHLRGLTR